MPGPLDGIPVLNWSQFTPSSAGYMLGDLGASPACHPERSEGSGVPPRTSATPNRGAPR
jgi:hypothetical protein